CAEDPDFSDVDDILEGQRKILRIDDLLMADPEVTASDFTGQIWTFEMNRDQVVDFAFSAPYSASCTMTDDGRPAPQQTQTMRMFEGTYDDLVSLVPSALASGSGCTGSSNMAVHVEDRVNPVNNTTTVRTMSANWLQTVVGDFNTDGYDDLFV